MVSVRLMAGVGVMAEIRVQIRRQATEPVASCLLPSMAGCRATRERTERHREKNFGMAAAAGESGSSAQRHGDGGAGERDMPLARVVATWDSSSVLADARTKPGVKSMDGWGCDCVLCVRQERPTTSGTEHMEIRRPVLNCIG